MIKKNIVFVVMIIILSLNVFGALSDGLTHYYTFENTSDTLLTKNFTNNGGATFGTGKTGNALILDGTEKWLSASTPIPNSTFSFSVWYKSNSATQDTYATLFHLQNGSNSNGFFIHADDNIADVMNFGYFGGTKAQFTYNIRTQSSWSNMVVVSNSTLVKLYQDGLNIANYSATGNYAPETLAIGHDPTASGRNFNGIVDEFSIWDRALTQDEISSLYNNGTGLFYPFTTPAPTPLNFTYTKTCYFNGTGLSLNLMSGCY